MRDSAINFVRKEELSQTGDAVIDKYVLGVREHEIEDITSYAAKADRQVDERFKSKRSWTGKDAKKLSMMNNDLEDQIHTVDTYANIAVGMIEQEVKPEQPACKI
jgi:hypothetical protein